MKNSIVVLLLIFTIEVFGQNCQPDPNASGLIYPPVSGIQEILINQFEERVITVTVPKDSSVANPIPNLPPVTANIDSVKLTNILGLPIGVDYACNTATCAWPGESIGCVSLYGTPTTLGIYPLTVEISVFLSIANIPLPTQNESVSTFSVAVVDEFTNIPEFSSAQLIKLYPNPSNGVFWLNAPKELTKADIQILDILGQNVNFELNTQGQSSEINLQNALDGIYFVKEIGGSFVQKVVIQN